MIYFLLLDVVHNKTCHRDRIARLTAPCPSHKNFNVKPFAYAVAAWGSTVFRPYQDNEGMMMKDCVQGNTVYD